MKKAVVVTLSIIISISLICFVAWRVFVNVAGGFVINKLVESVDDDTIDQLEKSLEQVENLDALLGQVENSVAEQPGVGGQKTEQSNVPAVADGEVKKDVSKKETSQTPLPKSANTTEKADESKKKDDSVGSKLDKVSYEDKSAAIKMLKNKFTVSEIMYYQDMVFNGGLNAELIKEVKTILKQRCTKEEIAQLKEWYNKYK